VIKEEKKMDNKSNKTLKNKFKFSFFNKDDDKINQPKPSEIHKYAETDYFEFNPPIPIFNYIIDPVTLEITEDLTGKP